MRFNNANVRASLIHLGGPKLMQNTRYDIKDSSGDASVEPKVEYRFMEMIRRKSANRNNPEFIRKQKFSQRGRILPKQIQVA
jgi:hypothetical protein